MAVIGSIREARTEGIKEAALTTAPSEPKLSQNYPARAPYSTISWILAACGELFPVAVAEMEMVEVPAGVPGLLGVVPPPPPQPIKEALKTQAVVNKATAWNNWRERRLALLTRASPRRPAKLTTAPAGNHGSLPGKPRGFCRRSAVEAAVETVNITCTGWPPPGVTAGVAKAQLIWLGSAPQLRVTAVVNPPAGVTVTVKVADWPGVTVAEAGDTATAKLGATMMTVIGEEVLARLFASPP
jgi:hypothetical protein